MDLFELLSKKIIVPLYNWKFGIDCKEELKFLKRSQFFSSEKLRDIQWHKIKNIIAFAYDNNEFYKNSLDKAGVHPDDINSHDDFRHLPVLTKDDIRDNMEKMISSGYTKENMQHKRTGGSTGVPVHLYVDSKAMNNKRAAVIRHNGWANYEQGAKRAALWGDTDKKYSLKEKMYFKLYERTIYLDTLKMDDDYLFDFINKIRRFKPRSLIGHGHSLYFLAKFCGDNKIDDIKFEGIISTAETLFDSERKIVEDVFGKNLFDRYGCEELSIIASECEAHEGLHIHAEGLYVEVIGGDEATPGELVITDLDNYGMPFIRYRIGDMATILNKPCPCGRGLPRLGKVFGRITDILYTPEKKKISGVSILDTFMIHINGLKQVQITQDKLDHIHFKIVKDNNYDDTTFSELKRNVAEIFGPQMKFSTEFVNEIPKTARGKFQFTICNIKDI